MFFFEVSGIDPGVELQQRVFRLSQTGLATYAVALAFFTGVDPVDPIPTFAREVLADKNGEIFGLLLVVQFGSSPELFFGFFCGAYSLLELADLGPGRQLVERLLPKGQVIRRAKSAYRPPGPDHCRG